MPTDTLIDCLNIIQSRRAMNKPDYHNRRTELTTWIKDMIRERTRPPYTWRKLIQTLTEDEHTTLQVEFGCSHKSYVNELMQILNPFTPKKKKVAPIFTKISPYNNRFS